MNKEKNVILMRAGQHRAVTMPNHELTTIGHSTFVVTGMDTTHQIQWSVIGARKSELHNQSSDPRDIGVTRCIVHVLNDQYSVEDRIVNVSCVGKDRSTGELVEATATLTIKVKAAAAVEDFTFGLEYPEQIITDGGKTDTTPNPIIIKAKINEVVPTGNDNPYHLLCTVDTDDQTSTRLIMVQSTTAGKGNEFMADSDAMKEIVNKCYGVASQNGYSVLNFTVDALKVWKNDEEHHYKQAQGGKIIIKPKG